MKILHFTNENYIKNIQNNGMKISEKQKIYKHKPCKEVDKIIDSYIGDTRNGKYHLMRSNAHYFIFEHDEIYALQNEVGVKVCVDVEQLDKSKLYISSMLIPEKIFETMNQSFARKDIELWCMHYWNDLFPWEYYLENKEVIDKTYMCMYGTPFIPEILYFKDIDAKMLTIKLI